MMSIALPRFINPWQQLTNNPELTGTVTLADLTRLAKFLSDLSGNFTCSISLYQEPEEHFFISLVFETEVVLQCQRCLEDYHLSIATTSNLIIFTPEQESCISMEDYDCVLTAGDKLDLYDIITDEIILSLPAIITHEKGQCKLDLIQQYTDIREVVRSLAKKTKKL